MSASSKWKASPKIYGFLARPQTFDLLCGPTMHLAYTADTTRRGEKKKRYNKKLNDVVGD
jgi:hypothetical protein